MLTYIEATQREREKEQTKMKEKPYKNLTENERTSMKELSEREDIIIAKTDKGGAAVIVGVKDYIKEAERQLNNTENYRKLQEGPIAINMKLVNDTIKRFKKQKRNDLKREEMNQKHGNFVYDRRYIKKITLVAQ